MKIAIIGTGYVGLVTGTCLANLGNDVTCLDIDENKINKLKNGEIPIYEPGLLDMVKRNAAGGRLRFETQLANVLDDLEIIFIAVGTPPKEDGEADLQYVEAVAHEIGLNLKHDIIIVNKSTVPIGTGDRVAQIIRQYYSGQFTVVSNPEFLREGSAVQDFNEPDRIVLGCDSQNGAIEKMKELYKPLNCPVVVTDLKSAEMIKYASNSFLAMSISFINSIALICDKVGADVGKVSEGMRLDKRIGKNAFLHAGCGYGGSCFPKDVQALIKIGETHKQRFSILEEVEKTNEQMKEFIVLNLLEQLGDLREKKIALWGLAFKPNTDDIRFAPALTIIQQLLNSGAIVQVFDSVAMDNMRRIFPNIIYCANPYDAVKDAAALAIVTDWSEFKQIDKQQIKKLMAGNLIIDGRNIYEPEEMRNLGFQYFGVGRR